MAERRGSLTAAVYGRLLSQLLLTGIVAGVLPTTSEPPASTTRLPVLGGRKPAVLFGSLGVIFAVVTLLAILTITCKLKERSARGSTKAPHRRHRHRPQGRVPEGFDMPSVTEKSTPDLGSKDTYEEIIELDNYESLQKHQDERNAYTKVQRPKTAYRKSQTHHADRHLENSRGVKCLDQRRTTTATKSNTMPNRESGGTPKPEVDRNVQSYRRYVRRPGKQQAKRGNKQWRG